MKRHIFRLGDRVHIIDPRRILSVGYATNIDTMMDIAAKDERVISFCKSLNLNHKRSEKVIRVVAGAFLAKSLRSGTQRTITFSDPDPDLLTRTFTVVSKHVCYTGTYSAASGGGNYGEYDYDPACLCNTKAHVILELIGYRFTQNNLVPFHSASAPERNKYASGLFVTTDQVKPVTDDDDK